MNGILLHKYGRINLYQIFEKYYYKIYYYKLLLL